MSKYKRVQLISPGGVGSVMVRNALYKSGSMSKSTDVNRHRRSPDIGLPEGLVIYLFGDPRNQILSFYRRGFFKAPYAHCKHMSGDVKSFAKKRSWTLDEYLENGKDFFRLEEHFMGWWNYTQRDYDILFLRYEAIENNKLYLENLLGVKLSFKFKIRNSNYSRQSEKNKALLNKMYGDYCNFLDHEVNDGEKFYANK